MVLHVKGIGILSGIALVTGLIADIYPALILSGSPPIKVLKNNQIFPVEI
ncbi:hypothetical protein SAMN05661012_04642 [Chitinophaga sancti]|uniref:Uncharacterized protein n=1 Tax=Chitinophaga sancti TaxID=1004 RepID=A0A1K1S2S1_9BACT|nr:hypothetical protein SAMN05661012_04642 [Chitinophaga sancti]